MLRVLLPVLLIGAVVLVIWLVTLIRRESAKLRDASEAQQEQSKDERTHRAQILMKRDELLDWYNQFIIKADSTGERVPRELIEARNKMENPPTPAHLEAFLHDFEAEKSRLEEK